MASPPSRAASRPRTIVAFLNSVDVFELPFSFDWCRLRVDWWSETVESELSGDPWRPTMAATGRRWRRRPSLSLSFALDDISRPFDDRRTRLEDTPSWGKIYKEPLRFHEIEPAVLSVI
jgi:hypothetical protein